jgi:hypothetical protein
LQTVVRVECFGQRLLNPRGPAAELCGNLAAVVDERLFELVLHLDECTQCWVDDADAPQQQQHGHDAELGTGMAGLW